MRLSAYKKAIQEASQLPIKIPEFKRYFGFDYNPRRQAICEIVKRARLDTDALYDSELVEVLKTAEEYL